jgi:hypothetical protein
MTKTQHLWDIIVRSVKTALEAYAAFVLAGGLNITHLSAGAQIKIAALAALVTGLLNAGIKVHNAVAPQNPTPLEPAPPIASIIIEPTPVEPPIIVPPSV